MPTRRARNDGPHQRRTALALVALMALASCTQVAAPSDAISLLKAELAMGPIVFVLAQVGDTVMEPMVTSDRQCGAVRTVDSIVDTITVFADGTARRATRTILAVNGVEQAGSVYVESGLWAPIKGPNIYYYSDSPSIVITVFSGVDRIPINLNFRLRGTTALTQLNGIGGGACPGGVLSEPRTVEWVYTRR